RRTEAVEDDRADIEFARIVKRQQAQGDLARLVEREAAATDLGQALVDEASVVAAQAVAPLPTDRQDLDRLAGIVEVADAASRLAQDRRVEAAGEAAVGGRDDKQMGVVGAGGGEEERRPRLARAP